ncbi:MAG: hypothetical protein WCL51_03485 [Bacteroidota bacterium]
MKAIIDNHRRVAKYLEDAAQYHLVAARFHEANNHHKAINRTLIALGNTVEACSIQNEISNQYINTNN